MRVLEKGDSVRVITKGRTIKEYIGVVVGDYDGYISVNKGNYVESIDKVNIINGSIEVKVNNKDGEKMSKKITSEELLKEVKKHGWNDEAAKLIGEKYGLSKLTIKTYYGKWKIADQIDGQKDSSLREALMNEEIEKKENKIEKVKPEGKQEIQSLCISEIKFEGDILDYNVVLGAEEIYFKIKNKDADENIYIDVTELSKVIKELSELEISIGRVING